MIYTCVYWPWPLCAFIFITCIRHHLAPAHLHSWALAFTVTSGALTTCSLKVLCIFAHMFYLFIQLRSPMKKKDFTCILSPAESNAYLWVDLYCDPFSQGYRSQDTPFHDIQEWHSSRSGRSLTGLENLPWPMDTMKAGVKSGHEPKQMEQKKKRKPFTSPRFLFSSVFLGMWNYNHILYLLLF